MATTAPSTDTGLAGLRKAEAAEQRSSPPVSSPVSTPSGLQSGEASLLSLLPARISCLLPSLVSAPLSSLTFSSLQNHAVTSGLIPDVALRRVCRYLIQQRYAVCHSLDVEALAEYKAEFIAGLLSCPIAVHAAAANAQHYEVPAAFYEAALGKRLKYSCAYYPTMREPLDAAEDAMLALYLERAQLGPHQRILDLGCGWGSFTLYAAQRLPDAHFTAVSNSQTQRAYIEHRAAAAGLSNVTVLTCDINDPAMSRLPAFDRVVSIEMFEHMKNYARLLQLISGLLRPSGLLFVHLFAHQAFPYHFTPDSGWMAQHFFTGGTMPSADLLLFFNRDLAVVQQWAVSGLHYARTSRHWLDNVDRNAHSILPVLKAAREKDRTAGVSGAGMLRMWRLFFIAVEELFAWNQGQEWCVQHYLFSKPNH